MCAKQLFPWEWQECSVTVTPSRASVVWKLRHFSRIDAKAGDYLESQKFDFLNGRWSLEMYPHGRHPTFREVLLCLKRASATNESQKVKYKFFCRDESMKECHSTEGSGDFDGIKIKALLSGDLRELLLAEDCLTVCCEVKDPDAGEQEEAPSETDYTVCYLDDGVKVLIRDLQNICEKESNSDVRLKVGNAEFPAHKLILASRSSVFASILKENPSLEVIELDVEDCSLVKDFLRYMYTGKLGELSSAPKLFVAANTYELKQLQEECLMFMKTHFCVGSICSYVKLASKYENAELMARAKTFFNENVALIISSTQWTNFAKECPALANDLLQFTLVTGSKGTAEWLNSEQEVISAVTSVYEDTLFPDVTLKVGREDLPAHKAILSSRSSVFRGMFQADMKENRERVADIQEMDVQTARQMLRYIYTGKVCDLEEESAKSLYIAADRYDLQGLKARCLQYLLKSISVDNVCQLALLADLHLDEKLNSAVRLFIRKNHQSVLQSAIWKESAAEKPAFFMELISSVLMNLELMPKNSE